MNINNATIEDGRVCVRRLVLVDGTWQTKQVPVEGVGDFPLDDFLFFAATATSGGDLCRCLGFDEDSLDAVCKLVWGARTRDVLWEMRKTNKTTYNSTVWDEAVKMRNTQLIMFEGRTRQKRVETARREATTRLSSSIRLTGDDN